MSYVTTVFKAYTSKVLEATDVYLPLDTAALTDLLQLLSTPGSYTYLTLQDNTNIETVKAYAESGYILLNRGLSGTTAVKHPFGTCVTSVSPTIAQVIRDLICCSDSTETALTIKSSLGGGTVNHTYMGWIYCEGALPITITVTGAPAWATVTKKDNLVTITGTPTEKGTSTLTCNASNTDGNITATLTLTIT